MRMKTASPVITVVASLILASVAYSHDIWLFTKQFNPAQGETIRVFQVVGHELGVELLLPLQKDITRRFELVTPNGSVDLLSALPDETHPLLEGMLDFEGLALLTMEHGFLRVEFSGDKFSEYLKHEEFKKMEQLRNKIGRRPKERERYMRTLKSLIQVGRVREGDLYKRVLGQKIEMLLVQNPYLLDPGDDLEVQVLFDGKPLSETLVWLYNGEPKRLVSKSKARTNAAGVARFKLDREGLWLFRVVHLLPCSDCSDADWESYWSSYTFKLD